MKHPSISYKEQQKNNELFTICRKCGAKRVFTSKGITKCMYCGEHQIK